mmetsp:Transcript_9982/g.32351  ORF Transcript_9982/g.32351 Transcript_9982/m.32351 type:complete len:232 (+) Transcript_9982:1046-1741(+)
MHDHALHLMVEQVVEGVLQKEPHACTEPARRNDRLHSGLPSHLERHGDQLHGFEPRCPERGLQAAVGGVMPAGRRAEERHQWPDLRKHACDHFRAGLLLPTPQAHMAQLRRVDQARVSTHNPTLWVQDHGYHGECRHEDAPATLSEGVLEHGPHVLGGREFRGKTRGDGASHCLKDVRNIVVHPGGKLGRELVAKLLQERRGFEPLERKRVEHHDLLVRPHQPHQDLRDGG